MVLQGTDEEVAPGPRNPPMYQEGLWREDCFHLVVLSLLLGWWHDSVLNTVAYGTVPRAETVSQMYMYQEIIVLAMFPFALGIPAFPALPTVLAGLLVVSVGVAMAARATSTVGAAQASRLAARLRQRRDGVWCGAEPSWEAGEGAKAGGVIDGWADVAPVRLLEMCRPMESSHDGESSEQAAELEPRSMIVSGGVTLSCHATVLLIESSIPSTATEWLKMCQAWSAETSGPKESRWVRTNSLMSLRSHVVSAPPWGVGEGETTESAYKAYDRHVEWDGEQHDGAGGQGGLVQDGLRQGWGQTSNQPEHGAGTVFRDQAVGLDRGPVAPADDHKEFGVGDFIVQLHEAGGHALSEERRQVNHSGGNHPGGWGHRSREADRAHQGRLGCVGEALGDILGCHIRGGRRRDSTGGSGGCCSGGGHRRNSGKGGRGGRASSEGLGGIVGKLLPYDALAQKNFFPCIIAQHYRAVKAASPLLTVERGWVIWDCLGGGRGGVQRLIDGG
ncbi:hypothetical protein B0H14DRAFT_2635570 [Mycena olivaceomarginata]|nr:hypothetical protein B0H14DRAFT_2635570 [Mycena olivaceomarginata]